MNSPVFKHQINLEASTEDSFYVSFTDVLSLLLIFFIYLVSISTINPAQLLSVSQSVKKHLGLHSPSPPNINIAVTNQYAKPNIKLTLNQDFLFSPGSDQLQKQAHQYLKKLASVISSEPVQVSIEGHTDNTPISTKKFPSNWHLSAYRASAVLTALEKFGVSNKQLKLSAYGDSQPLYDNTSPNNRKKNRRVIIRITDYQNNTMEEAIHGLAQ